MRISIQLAVIIIMIAIQSCMTKKKDHIVYRSDSLVIEQVSDHIYKHVTYLETETFGKVSCNGMFFSSKNEAIVFDTPTNDKVSKELIDWIETNLEASVKGVVINHFHDDGLGGLKYFHEKGIQSYSNNLTIKEAKKYELPFPQNGFDNSLELTIGGKKVINQYFGQGHSKDNIVSYIPSEQVMFGGCMIKTINAEKGYLGTADINEWPKTVAKVKSNFPNVKIVIPGHGKIGGTDLFDYTIKLFQE